MQTRDEQSQAGRGKSRRIQTRLLVSMVLLVLLSCGTYTIILLTANRQAMIREADARLLAAATCRAGLGRAYHDRIRDQRSISPDEYASVVATNDDLCRRLRLQYLWSVLVLDGKIVFTSAAHSDLNDPRSDCAAFLEVHSDPEAFAQAIQTGRVTYATFHNKWGQGRDVLVPGRDSLGRTYMVGASIQLSRLGAMVRRTVLEGLAVGAGIALLAGLVSWMLSRSLSAPIVRLTADAQRMAGGDLDTRLSPSGSREVVVLAQSLDALRQAVRRQVDTLRENQEALARRASQLRQLAGELTRAEECERRRLADILHEDLQQLVVGAKIYVQSEQAQPATPAGREPLRQAVDMLEQALRLSRSLTSELSPPILYQGGLVAGLRWLQRWMEETHCLRVQLDADPAAEPPDEDLRVMLFRAVQELLFNVVKHSGASAAHVRAGRQGERLEITVRDDGKGFDPAQAERVGGGGGFGLFRIRERLVLAGGDMEIDSAPGRGSCVRLWAPLRAQGGGDQAGMPAPAGPAATPGAESSQARAPASARRIRVLLADDHEMVRKGLVNLLSQSPDMEVVGEAGDGRAVVDLALRLRADVVVMDVTMPGLDGLGATRRLAEAAPGVRVIGLSMHSVDDLGQQMRQAGAFAYLAKDRAADALVSAIRAAMGTAR